MKSTLRTAVLVGPVLMALAGSPQPATPQGPSSPALLAETGGGILGSLAGLGLGLAISRPDRCDSEDIECALERASLAALTSIAGATVGAVMAGKAVDSEPSAAGAVLGAIAGTVAGVVMIKVIDEAFSGRQEGAGAVVTFSVSQGFLTAVGSRLGRLIGGPD